MRDPLLISRFAANLKRFHMKRFNCQASHADPLPALVWLPVRRNSDPLGAGNQLHCANGQRPA